MKNNNKKILVGILTGAMLLTSVTAVSAASVGGQPFLFHDGDQHIAARKAIKELLPDMALIS